MSGILNRILLAFQLNLVFSMLSMLFGLTFMESKVHAAITWSGNISPAVPTAWTSNTFGYIGYSYTGTITVNDGSVLLNRTSYLGYNSGSFGTVTIHGTNSKWIHSGSLVVGNFGTGTLKIEAGGFVSNEYGYVGDDSSSNGTVSVIGANSTWINNNALFIGYYGKGTLNIVDGGQVSCFGCLLGDNKDFLSTATITGAGSLLTVNPHVNGGFDISNAIMKIEAGGQVVCNTDGFIGYNNNSTVSITGNDSKWTSNSYLYVGYLGTGILNIGTSDLGGGTVMARQMTLAYNKSGTCTLDNGGALIVGSISKGIGVAAFNWNDGTIQSYDSLNHLTIDSNLVLKLAATGNHTFNFIYLRGGTVNAVIADATSGGTLNKKGIGALTLTAINTYSGETTVEEGWLSVRGSILNTSGISIKESGVLDLANTSGSATSPTVRIDNHGTIIISAGSQKVGAITGTGTTKVKANATLTASSIMQNSLTIGGSGASSMNAVPEPSTLLLLSLAALGLVIRRLKSK